jgi:ATP-dependent RNA helicase SUPV3L1/SUV3
LRKQLGPLVWAGESALAAPARGLVFQLSEQLGSVPRRQVRSLLAAMARADRAALTRLGLRFGAQGIFFPALLRPAALQLRMVLWNACHGGAGCVAGSAPAAACEPAARYGGACWSALGYAVFGPMAIRYDRLEQLSASLHKEARGGLFAETPALSSLAGCSGEDFAAIVSRLGFRVRQGDGGPLFVPKRRSGRGGKQSVRKNAADGAPAVAETAPGSRLNGRGRDRGDAASPFAALRTLVTAK